MPSSPAARRRPVPLAVPADGTAPALLPALRAALSGAGPALLPHPAGRPPPPLLDDSGTPDDDPLALLVATSGSSGRPRLAELTASALLASAAATHDRLGGPGRWLLALPAEHVAGLQVLVRSLVARTEPVALDLTAGFGADGFVAATARLAGPRRYTALVPTQLVRLLDAGGVATTALAGYHAVLVGGAATPPELRARATEAGVRLVLSYGMTETCGGCVYDGVPLDGVDVRVDDGRIRLGGPVLARGYLGDPAGTADAFVPGGGRRWFRTGDLGRWDGARLEVDGRADDVVVTGGLKVAPAAVERALTTLPEVAEAVVVGLPDREWGSRVAAAIVLRPGARRPSDEAVRAAVAAVAGSRAVPRQLAVLAALPARGPGKPDRAAVAALLTEQHAGGG